MNSIPPVGNSNQTMIFKANGYILEASRRAAIEWELKQLAKTDPEKAKILRLNEFANMFSLKNLVKIFRGKV